MSNYFCKIAGITKIGTALSVLYPLSPFFRFLCENKFARFYSLWIQIAESQIAMANTPTGLIKRPGFPMKHACMLESLDVGLLPTVMRRSRLYVNSVWSAFLQREQCSHCKRWFCYSNSVCPSVRPSVTRRYCVKTKARSTVQFAPLDSKMCLVL